MNFQQRSFEVLKMIMEIERSLISLKSQSLSFDLMFLIVFLKYSDFHRHSLYLNNPVKISYSAYLNNMFINYLKIKDIFKFEMI